MDSRLRGNNKASLLKMLQEVYCISAMKVLAIPAHPDDETLGCGGTLLKHRAEGDELFWLIASTRREGR